MTGIRRGLACIVTLLLICGGTIVAVTRFIGAEGKVESSSEVVADDPSPKARNEAGRPIPGPADAEAEFQAALLLFHEGKLAEAEKRFTRIAKDRQGTTWGEKSQYELAECQYQQKKYVYAYASFERLHVDYPATVYLPNLVRREHELAQLWLAQSDSQVPAEQKLPWTAHFDGRLPILDTPGSALQVLESVRQHEPDGPLADDATIRIADYYMKDRDFESAALYYECVIAEYRRSPLLPYARFAAIEARMPGNLGPQSNRPGLETARTLVKQILRTFPDFDDHGNPNRR
jgi:outer membrane protein assembly factor BamD (BamD/ComL family)